MAPVILLLLGRGLPTAEAEQRQALDMPIPFGARATRVERI